MSDTETIPADWSDYAAYLHENTPLTERQAEVYVLRKLVPTDVVADELDIEPKTVNRHLMDARDRVDAAALLADLDPLHERYHRLVSKPVASQTYETLTYTLYEGLTQDGKQTYLLERDETTRNVSEPVEADTVLLDEQRTRQVGEYADIASLTAAFSTAEDTDIVDVAVAYVAVTDAVSLPPLADLYPDTPDPETVADLVDGGVLSSDEARALLDDTSPTPTTDRNHVVLGDTEFGPIEYPLADGCLNMVFGNIGSGKSLGTTLLMRRLRQTHPDDVAVAFVDPLDSLVELTAELDGTVYESPAAVDEVDDYTALSLDPTKAEQEVVDQYLEGLHALLDAAEAAARPVALVLDEAHILARADSDALGDVFDRARETTLTTFFVAQAVEESAPLWRHEAYEPKGRDGMLVFFVPRTDALREEFALSLDHIEFLRNGVKYKSEEPGIAALALPPQNTNWLGVRVLPTAEEHDILNHYKD